MLSRTIDGENKAVLQAYAMLSRMAWIVAFRECSWKIHYLKVADMSFASVKHY